MAFNLTTVLTDAYLKVLPYNMSTVVELWKGANGDLAIKLSVSALIQGTSHTSQTQTVVGSIPLASVTEKLRVMITGGMAF